jgi:autotransporter-associated beta strand protein
MSGSGALAKAGSGTVTLSGNNSSYNGAIDLQAGGLIAANNNALGSSAVTMTNGSIQAANGVSIANNFTIGVSGGVTTNAYSSTTVAGWDFSTNAGGAGNWGPSPMAPTTNAAGVSIVGLTRGSGLATTNNGAAGAWGANTWGTNITDASGAIAAGKLATFAITVSNGYALNLTNFGAYNIRRSGSGPTTGIWQWSTNGTDFTDIGTAITWGSTTTAAGNAQSAISITNINQLQALGGGSTVTLRVLNWGATGEAGSWYLNASAGGTGTALDFLLGGQIATVVSNAAVGTGTLGISEAGTATFSGTVVNNNAATFIAAAGGTAIFSNVISGAGTVTKTGAGTVTLSGASANTFTGSTTVSAGTLQLSKGTDVAGIAGNITVNTGATLLLSSSGNVANTSAVTLSGGTILRDGGVSEIFGNLNLTTDSTLDFGIGTAGALSFGTYTESALLTVANFLPGNKLQFATGFNSALLPTGGSLSNENFSFSNGFTTGTEGGYFTITAIPEPSTYLAAAGLLSLMLWPSRKRIIRDAKKILGFTPPMRDRLAARSKA